MNQSHANTAMSVTDAVLSRMSARAFTDQLVDPALLRRILETARRSPSGGNVQPWHIVVLGGTELAGFKALMRERLNDPRSPGDGPEYPIYPKDLGEPYRSRRFKCGEDMHGTMGIARENKDAPRGSASESASTRLLTTRVTKARPRACGSGAPNPSSMM